MSIGNCECINKGHKTNIIKALENEIYKLETEYRSIKQTRKNWDKSFEQGRVSVSAEKLLELINQNIDNFQFTLSEINSTVEC